MGSSPGLRATADLSSRRQAGRRRERVLGLPVQPSAILYALPRLSTFSEVMLRPGFFFSAPDIAPLTV
jgi:hypothetical protein